MGKKKGGKKKKGNPVERFKAAKRMELALEIEMGDVNAAELRRVWRERMKKINLPVVKENLETAWKIFDRAVDTKNYSISILLDGLDEAEEQKRRSDNLHLDTLNELLQNYRKIVDAAEAKYQQALDTAIDDDQEFRDYMDARRAEKEMYLKTVCYATKQSYDRSIENIHTRNSSKLDTRKEEFGNMFRLAQEEWKRRIRHLRDENVRILHVHDENTKEKQKEFNTIKLRNDEDEKIISQQSRRIEKLFNDIAVIRKVTADFRAKSQKEIEDYVFERDYFYEAYIRIQKRLLAEQIFDKEQLRTTTMEYKVTEEYLDARLSKLEKILSIKTLCEKFETYEDKILIYPVANPTDSSLCGELNKLRRVIATVQSDVDNLKILHKETTDEFNTLKDNLRLYLEEVAYGRPEPCVTKDNARPAVIDLRKVIKY